MKTEIVVGVFVNRDDAARAVEDVVAAGFREDEIGFAIRNGGAAPIETSDLTASDGPASSAATGVITGGVLGGLIAAAAALIVPGVGPVLAGGLLASALSGAAIGAAAGGVLGALVGLGVPEEEAALLQDEFHAGRAVVTVRAGDRAEEVRTILHRHGAKGRESSTPS
ncbi:MAG: general stress protein [Chloroflexota bacterium]